MLVGNVFFFKVSEEGGVFFYKIKISLLDEFYLVIILIKNCCYIGDSIYVFKKKKLLSVEFEVKELVELDDKE